MTDDLTIEQLERIIANHENGMQLTGADVYRQLLATMRREAKLKKGIQYIIDHEWTKEKSGSRKWLIEFIDVAKQAILSCEYSVEIEK